MPDIQLPLAMIGGLVVGFSLALVGGGGSILAVPMLVYAVGIRDPHVAIGTSAVGVAATRLAASAIRIRALRNRGPPQCVLDRMNPTRP